MFSLPLLTKPAQMPVSALNALLEREAWARERLASHSGKAVRFIVGPGVLNLSILGSGLVTASDPAIVPNATFTIPLVKLASLPGVLRSRDPSALTALLHVEGDAALAQVVSDLAGSLRWDLQEDLSRVVGDVATTRLVGAGKLAASGLNQAAERLAGNVSEYITEESGMMAARPAFQGLSADMRSMLQRLEQLEARVGALNPARRGSSSAKA
ncbi:SCP2 domain-containing protein [Allopusillimonas ginsengisoli]|uniref:ubiquinone biosynthesis accessory factor UbiJ n=1 Tax=Allopusillimonas ginsengisoli TaxID=453575 RepID=UPI0039C2F691